jgi:hypothetical protein
MRYTAQELRRRGGQAALELGNVVRRVLVAATSGDAWGYLGYQYPDLRGRGTTITEGAEDEPVEVFPGVGIFARPAAGDASEALLVNVGGKAEHGVIVALRNEDARRRYVEEFGEIDPGEIVIFNSIAKSRVIVRADGTIELEADAGKEILIRSKSGATDSLVTTTEFLKHGHPTAGTGAVSGPVVAPAPGPGAPFPGTTVLKAE